MFMNYSNLIVEEYQENRRVVILSLNRPKQYNALNQELVQELRSFLKTFQKDDSIGALILTSNITKAFCTGIDVKSIGVMENKEAAEFFATVAETLDLLVELPCTTIAAINGYAFGAGADLAISCDLRIGSASSSFSFPGPQFGVILGTHRLVNEVGPPVARKLVLTGQRVDAELALKYGLLQEITDKANALETALGRARNLSNISPYTQVSIKQISNGKQISTQETSVSIAKQSVLEGDFQERFMTYVERVKQKKK